MDIFKNLPEILPIETIKFFAKIHDGLITEPTWETVCYTLSGSHANQVMSYISEKSIAEYEKIPIEKRDAQYRAGVIHYLRDCTEPSLFEEFWYFVRYQNSQANIYGGTYASYISYYSKDYMTDREKFTFFDSADSPFAMCYPCRIELEDEVFLSASHYIAYAKAEIVRDRPKMKAILEETDIYRACALGREAKFDKGFYDFMIGRWMRIVLYAKFTQNEDLKQALLATEGTTLALASDDRYWSIGWHKGKRSEWRDQNLLGELLTETRLRIAKKY